VRHEENMEEGDQVLDEVTKIRDPELRGLSRGLHLKGVVSHGKF